MVKVYSDLHHSYSGSVLCSLNRKEIGFPDHRENKFLKLIYFQYYFFQEYNYKEKSRMPVCSLFQLLHSQTVLMCILLKIDCKKVPVLLPVTVPSKSLLKLYKV